jgi:hypothetical protein
MAAPGRAAGRDAARRFVLAGRRYWLPDFCALQDSKYYKYPDSSNSRPIARFNGVVRLFTDG